MKIITVGCTHAGTAALLNAAKLYPEAEITVYERNDNVSFLSCGIALYVEGIVKDVQGLFYSSPEQLASLGVLTKMKHDVVSIDMQKKTMVVKNLLTEEEFEDAYDKLIITSGSWPICPPFEGIDLGNILLCKNFHHAQEIIAKTPQVKNVTVIGAGYIGVELVEAFREQGKEVTLIDVETRILSKYFDKEFTDLAEQQFKDHGVKFALGEKVVRFAGSNGIVTKVITDKTEHETDLVILCIGFRPNTALFKGQVNMLPNGAIVVDDYMQTSVKDVFAAGDCCTVHYNPTDEERYIPLATNAVRMGTLVALNLMGPKIKQVGTQGTSGIKVYAAQMAGVGLTEVEARTFYKNVKAVTVTENYRPEFMPSYDEVMLRLVYDGDTRRILGAQLSSTADYTQTINTLSVCIAKEMTVEEIAFMDQFFQPHFNKPWNIINTAALKAL